MLLQEPPAKKQLHNIVPCRWIGHLCKLQQNFTWTGSITFLFLPLGESRTTPPCSVLEIYCRKFGRSSKSFWKSLPKLELASQPISDGLWIVSVFCILSNPDFSCLVFSLGNVVSANVSYYNCSIWNCIQRCEESLLSWWIELQTSRAPPPLLSSQDF